MGGVCGRGVWEKSAGGCMRERMGGKEGGGVSGRVWKRSRRRCMWEVQEERV